MQWSESIDKIIPALLKAQTEMKDAEKAGRNPVFKSTYPKLENVWDACKDPLHKNGLVLVQSPQSGPNDTYGVETTIFHSSGQWVRDTLLLKPSKNDPQGAGSAITYSRRYSLAAMVGVMQEDDDANQASVKQQSGTLEFQNPGGSSPQPQKRAQVSKNEVKADSNPGDYVIKFGKYVNAKISEIAPEVLKSYVIYLLDVSAKDQKPLSTGAAELIANAKAYLTQQHEKADGQDAPPPVDDDIYQIPF